MKYANPSQQHSPESLENKLLGMGNPEASTNYAAVTSGPQIPSQPYTQPVYPEYQAPAYQPPISANGLSDQLSNRPAANPNKRSGHKLIAAVAGIAVAGAAVFGIGSALAKPKEIAGTPIAVETDLPSSEAPDDQLTNDSPSLEDILNGNDGDDQPADQGSALSPNITPGEVDKNSIMNLIESLDSRFIPSTDDQAGVPKIGNPIADQDRYYGNDEYAYPEGEFVDRRHSIYHPTEVKSYDVNVLAEQIDTNLNCILNAFDPAIIKQCINELTGEADLPWQEQSPMTRQLYQMAGYVSNYRDTLDYAIFTKKTSDASGTLYKNESSVLMSKGQIVDHFHGEDPIKDMNYLLMPRGDYAYYLADIFTK